VHLLRTGSPGAQQWATALIAEIALVPETRDPLAKAGAVPPLTALISSGTVGTPEVAARALANLALADDDGAAAEEGAGANEPESLLRTSSPGKLPEKADFSQPVSKSAEFNTPQKQRRGSVSSIHSEGDGSAIDTDERGTKHESTVGSDRRRKMVLDAGGVKGCISMLDNSNLAGAQTVMLRPISIQGDGVSMGMQEQGAAALAEIAFGNAEMQDAIIAAGGVPMLLNVIRSGSPLGQEHAARAVRNTAERVESHTTIVDYGTIRIIKGSRSRDRLVPRPMTHSRVRVALRAVRVSATTAELVQLTKTGSQKAQEIAAAGLSDLARGAIVEREQRRERKRRMSFSHPDQGAHKEPPDGTHSPAPLSLGASPANRRDSSPASRRDSSAEVQASRRDSSAEVQASRRDSSAVEVQASRRDSSAVEVQVEEPASRKDRLMLISEAGGITRIDAAA
jgi:hypothetical protein